MVADAEPLLHVGSGPSRYGLAAIALHWISVLFVVVVGVLGLLHDSWPRQTQGFWINVHAILGLLVWVLAIARISWRRRHPAPALPNDVGRLSHRLSGPVHALLYILMLVIPILGIVTFIWHGRAFNFGLFQVNFGIRSNRSIFHPTENSRLLGLLSLRPDQCSRLCGALAPLHPPRRRAESNVACQQRRPYRSLAAFCRPIWRNQPRSSRAPFQAVRRPGVRL
jgi:cytochrome b561